MIKRERKPSQVNLWWLTMTPVKRRYKSSQVLHFRYIVWRLLDYAFVMIINWKCISMTRSCFLYYNLCINSEFPHFFSFSVSPWPVWFCCFRCECCFDSKQQVQSAAMFNFDAKDFRGLVFCVQTTRKSSQVERNLRWNLNKLKL